MCTRRTEAGGVKQRNHFEKARTCVAARRSRRQVTALPRTSLGTLFGRRGEVRCIFALFARRHWRGKEMRNAKPPLRGNESRRVAGIGCAYFDQESPHAIQSWCYGSLLPRNVGKCSSNQSLCVSCVVRPASLLLRRNSAVSLMTPLPASKRVLKTHSHL